MRSFFIEITGCTEICLMINDYLPLFTSKLWKKFLSLSSPSAVSTALPGVPRGVDVRAIVVLDARGEIVGAGDSISDG